MSVSGPHSELLDYLLEESLNELYVFDAETLKFLYVNRGARQNLGYSLEELRSLTPLDLKRSYTARSFAELLEPLRQGREHRIRFETEHWRKDGSRYPVEVFLELCRFAGRPAFVALIVDLTERREAERAVREAREKFWRLIEFGPDAMVVVDREGKIVYVNRQAEDLFGWTRDELLGQKLEVLLPEALRQVHVEHRRRYSAAPRHRLMGPGLELYALRRDGSTFAVDVSLGPIEAPEGLLVAASVRDNTERKQLEQRLRTSEQRYRSLVEGAVYGIYRSTLDGRLLEANPALVEMLGYRSREELLQLNLDRDVYADPGERSRLIAEHQSSDRFTAVETRWRRRDGRVITVRLSGRVLRDSKGQIVEFEGIAEDITERRLFEERLIRQQRLEAIGSLAAGVAHDFNNLLTVILNNSDLLLARLAPADPMRLEVEEIRHAALRGGELTRQLLAFSRRQSAKLEVLDLSRLLQKLEPMIRRLIGEDVRLEIHSEPGLWYVRADPAQLEQVVMNLVVNARDAMPHGGDLTLSVGNLAVRREDGVWESLVPPGEYLRFSVRDTGQGMSEEVRARAFEPFFTTKPVGKGSGLGLATVYGIVKQSGGFVWIDSAPGAGTTVTVLLPRTHESPPAEPAPTPRPEGVELQVTILLVEDEAPLRRAAARALEQHGFRVLSAAGGPEALALVRSHKGPIDLLITDLVMPEWSGKEVAERLLREHPALRVLYMSGYPDKIAGGYELSAAGTWFIAKPFDVPSLVAKVREVLSREP